MLIKILIIVAVIVVVLIVIVAMQPSAFRITRSKLMAASPAAVFEVVNDFHKWDAWSPWAKIDPAMKQEFDGPPAGAGSTYHWIGDKKVGEGRMTIVESQPAERIRIKLEFMRPFAATNDTLFTFQPQGCETMVGWTMTGQRNFMMKAFGLMMNMDKMVGGQFDQGLSQIKSIVEAK